MKHNTSVSGDALFVEPTCANGVFAAADASDLPALHAWCAGLAIDAYGQVFIECDSAEQLDTLPTPLDVSVTLVRPAGEAGEALARAVDAWLSEWLRAGHGPERSVQVFTGARTCEAMRGLWLGLEAELTES